MPKPHPGITMHKISFGGGFIGLVFALGSALIFLLGFPTLWYFVAFAFLLGIGIAALLHISQRRSAEKNKPLSILPASEAQAAPHERRKRRILFQIFPRAASA
jgi:hypothetical protein